MKFLADECCDLSTVDLLRDEGHDVIYIPENEPGISDSAVLLKSFKQNRILITEDKDFGNLVFRLKKPCFGIILLRFNPMEKEMKLSQVRMLTRSYRSKLEGNFVVVDSEKIRIRPLLN
jgi:predicted nuclease of predicted toxin-antitoxin system